MHKVERTIQQQTPHIHTKHDTLYTGVLLLLFFFWGVLCFFKNQSNKITATTSDQTLIFCIAYTDLSKILKLLTWTLWNTPAHQPHIQYTWIAQCMQFNHTTNLMLTLTIYYTQFWCWTLPWVWARSSVSSQRVSTSQGEFSKYKNQKKVSVCVCVCVCTRPRAFFTRMVSMSRQTGALTKPLLFQTNWPWRVSSSSWSWSLQQHWRSPVPLPLQPCCALPKLPPPSWWFLLSRQPPPPSSASASCPCVTSALPTPLKCQVGLSMMRCFHTPQHYAQIFWAVSCQHILTHIWGSPPPHPL